MARADRFTFYKQVKDIFVDFKMDFSTDPLTNSLALVKNEQAVIERLKNLVMIRPMELPYSYMGSKINGLLFDLSTNTDSMEQLGAEIQSAIQKYDPAVVNVRAMVKYQDNDPNMVGVTIVFDITNVAQDITFNTLIKRVR